MHEPEVRGVALHTVPVPVEAHTIVPVCSHPPEPEDVQLAPVARHVPPQLVCPEGHPPLAQRPAVQVALPPVGAVQRLPHVPQWAVSLVVSVSQPLAAMPSQSPRPAAQV